MSLDRVQQQPSYNIGNLGATYGTRLDFVWPQPGAYTCAFQVMPGDAFNLQGVTPGWYNWIFQNYQPNDPSLVQTVQIIFGNSMPPVFFGRRALGLSGVVGLWGPWQKILQWNGPGNPLTG